MFGENTKRVFHNRCGIFARIQGVAYGYKSFFHWIFVKMASTFIRMRHPVVVHLEIL